MEHQSVLDDVEARQAGRLRQFLSYNTAVTLGAAVAVLAMYAPSGRRLCWSLASF